MECDVLFLGYGPITHAFSKKLTASGQRVIAITETPITSTTGAEFPKSLFQIMSWVDVLNTQIQSDSTYVCWRQSPQNRVLGSEITDWVKSVNLKTNKIHHLSSASVYKGEQLVFSESDYDFYKGAARLNSKQELEALVLAISWEKQTTFVNYRISNVYGKGIRQGFINESIKNVKDHQPISIYKNIDLVRDYLLIDDLIHALDNLRLHRYPDEILNISTGHGVAISEVISHLRISMGEEFKFREVVAPDETLLRSVLSCNILERTIPWKPQGLYESLGRLFQEMA